MAKTLAEWLTRRVWFKIGGREWPLIFTYRALLVAQDVSGTEILNVSMVNPSAIIIRALIFAALSVAGAECALADVGRQIGPRLKAARRKLVDAWLASMPDPAPKRDADDRTCGEPVRFDWLDSWSAARGHHPTADEWLDMTPRMFHALEKLHLDQLRREEFLIGLIASTSANFSMCAPKKPLTAEAFMLHKFPEKDPEPVTGEYIMAQMARLRRNA